MKLARIFAAALLAILACTSDGETRPRGTVPFTAAPTGGATVNSSGNDGTGGFLNAIDSGNSYLFGGGATPAQVDANGYPNTTLTAGQTVSFAIPLVDSYQGSTVWLFKWTPAGNAVWFLNSGGWSNVSATGCSVTGSGTTTITMTAGTPCRVTFTWTVVSGGQISTEFRAAAYAPGSPKMVLCRLSDEAAIDAGGDFTSELITKWQGLSLRTIRMLSWNMSDTASRSTQSLWAYRTTRNSLAWKGERYPPGAWAGTSSGTNQYTTASLPADSGASGWVDGEVIQTTITNAATASTVSVSGAANNGSGLIRLTVSSTATFTTGQQVYISDISGTIEANGLQTITVNGPPGVATTIDLQGSNFVNNYQSSSGRIGVLSLTVTGKTGGTKFIANESGQATGSITAGQLYTLVYDELLGVLKARAGGITGAVPFEVQVNLANTVRVNLWTPLPTYATKTYGYATSAAALICSQLSSDLNWYPEYSNETWNTGFPQFSLMINQGNNLGIAGFSMHSLRHRQMMESIGTQWASSGCASSRLVRTLAWQAFGDSTTTSFKLNSSQLNTASNAKLLAYTGSINYTTAGQRAIDYADTGAYATYFSGALFPNGFGQGSRYQVNSSAQASIQALADLFNANPNDATALAIVDNDLRQGTARTQIISSVAGTTINVPSGLRGSDLTTAPTIGAAGSGYTNGTQILTILGGTCTYQPRVSVQVAGNVVTSVNYLASSGECSVAPTNPAATSGGGGTGATINVTYTNIYSNGQIGVFTVDPGGSLYSGVSLNTPYFIVNFSGASFGVSATSGGSAIALSGGSGTIRFGKLDDQTMLDLSRLVYQNVGGNTSQNPGWEQVAATYDAYRASVSRANLNIENYEGGLESLAPTTAQCTSMGVLVGGSAAACSAALTAGLAAYKNSSLGQALATSQFNQMMGRDASQPLTFGLMAHSKTPSWFLMTGPSQWSLLPGLIDTTPYKTYDGVAAFH